MSKEPSLVELVLRSREQEQSRAANRKYRSPRVYYRVRDDAETSGGGDPAASYTVNGAAYGRAPRRESE